MNRTELRKLAKAATPGPWWQEWVDGDEWFAVYGQPMGNFVCPEVCTTDDADDTNLLVAAVNALPGLLDELDETEAKLRRAHQIIGNITVRLNDTVVAELNTHWQGRLADAWDDGLKAASESGYLPDYIREDLAPSNPYRTGEAQK